MAIAWIILTISALGILFLLLQKIPGSFERSSGRTKIVPGDSFMSYAVRKLKVLGSKLWYFVLEAKDLAPSLPINPAEKAKKFFKIRVKEDESGESWLPEVSQTIEQPKVEDNKKVIENLYLETIKKDPSNKEAYEGLGRLYLQDKNYVEAAETFRFLTKLEPTRDIYWSNLGLSLYSSKEHHLAIDAYNKAIGINGKIPVRWINLALAFDALDETGKAVKAVNQAIALDQRNISYLMLLSDLYQKISNHVRSEEVLEKVLQLDPSNKQAREKLMRLKI